MREVKKEAEPFLALCGHRIPPSYAQRNQLEPILPLRSAGVWMKGTMAWKAAEMTERAYCAPLPTGNREKRYGKFTSVEGGHGGAFMSDLHSLPAAPRWGNIPGLASRFLLTALRKVKNMANESCAPTDHIYSNRENGRGERI